jgi:tetratricopeptide (TPR) repeat protein
MDIDIEEKRRKVIPRWRDFKTTTALGELHSSVRSDTKDDVIEGSLNEQIIDWQNNRSLAFATDLVGSGFVLGKIKEVEEAANFILSEESQASDIQKRIARQAKDPDFCAHLAITEETIPNSSDEIISHSRDRVRKYRAQLQNALRNPVKLVELSREYATLGSLEKALRTMDIAVGLAPANRFVLRSATRLFVHAGKIDKAHYVLKRAPSLRSDPWLLAAEIAVSSMMDRTSGHVRTGMQQISDRNFNAFEVSELASAIATLEMDNANGKLARKLFRQALRRPTENSIAQAEWASRSMENLSVEVREFDAPRKYEALAWSHFKQGEFNNALDEGKNWIRDQPFAVSPVIFTGMTATLMENYELGEIIFKFGLRANPENATLRNNLAFAFASDNEPELAESELERINRASITIHERIVITATEGLIRFRKGFQDEGRALYRRAIDLANKNNEPGYALRGLVFLAREEIYARTELAIQTLENAERESRNFHLTQEVNILLHKLNTIIESNPEAFSTSRRLTEGAGDILAKSRGFSK